ncbi:hypothetical protein L226DRAFT_68561 [Lentinus tigrinus ALCF2SS1-7]|uniref:Uncharacterized protein n=1 Tax=Lentinus tigrinus ALCF2SS1-6 TaxID=1328759 RepID=A0A5C2S8Y6_9APHY|nr:hypothetical protein L227DRAFT_109781 [Lentinus tigrinus ALCF2SS1-6]RPD74917.1 hypothetical protein L226DRAFT_68561 [Lentinus tigrinus ALCF2SS1-7]
MARLTGAPRPLAICICICSAVVHGSRPRRVWVANGRLIPAVRRKNNVCVCICRVSVGCCEALAIPPVAPSRPGSLTLLRHITVISLLACRSKDFQAQGRGLQRAYNEEDDIPQARKAKLSVIAHTRRRRHNRHWEECSVVGGTDTSPRQDKSWPTGQRRTSLSVWTNPYGTVSSLGLDGSDFRVAWGAHTVAPPGSEQPAERQLQGCLRLRSGPADNVAAEHTAAARSDSQGLGPEG